MDPQIASIKLTLISGKGEGERRWVFVVDVTTAWFNHSFSFPQIVKDVVGKMPTVLSKQIFEAMLEHTTAFLIAML